uniref:Uncharacterized protein n=1 Tax=Macaca fascicularis TaxID=9541 RepID=A0A7N9CQC8_MACFA
MTRNMVRPVNWMSMSPLLHFFSHNVSALVRGNAVWNTMMVDKAFCEFMDGSIGRSIACRIGKPISGVSVYSSEDKPLPLDAISRAQCWSVVANWALSNGHSQVSLGEWKSMLLSSYVTSISATTATLFLGPLGDDRGGWGERLSGVHRTGHPIYLIIKIFLC